MFVESEAASSNMLNKDREKGDTVNLSEYTGKLAPYIEQDGVWKFYMLLNAPHVALEELRDGDTDANEKRLQTCKSTTKYCFAVRAEVYSKRLPFSRSSSVE